VVEEGRSKLFTLLTIPEESGTSIIADLPL